MTKYVTADEEPQNIVTVKLIQELDGVDLVAMKGNKTQYLGTLRADGAFYLYDLDSKTAKKLGIQVRNYGCISTMAVYQPTGK